MVAGIPASGKEELDEYPDVITVDRPYANLASITQYLEAMIPTLNEGEPCYDQTVTKYKTHKEDRIFARLRIVDGHVSFIDSKSKVQKLLWGNTVNVKNKMRSIFDTVIIYSTY